MWPAKTVYEILDALRPRPGMYLGHASLGHLQAFLAGLRFANLGPGTPPVWEFVHWIGARVRGISITLPWTWLEQELGQKAALEAYFHYLDEYRDCKEVGVARPTGAELVPRFLRGVPGDMQTPVPPDRLYVGRFAPSKVFFLAEVYGDTLERCVPYQRTLKGAMEMATMWSVPVSAWKRRRTGRSR